jgi:hypothetical protein
LTSGAINLFLEQEVKLIIGKLRKLVWIGTEDG